MAMILEVCIPAAPAPGTGSAIVRSQSVAGSPMTSFSMIPMSTHATRASGSTNSAHRSSRTSGA